MTDTKQPDAFIEVDGEALTLDMETLTLGEAEELENLFGRPVGEEDLETARGTLYLTYLAMRRKNPKTTLDDIRKIEVRRLSFPEAEKETQKAKPKARKRPTKRGTSGAQS
jgi:hypothetical protein